MKSFPFACLIPVFMVVCQHDLWSNFMLVLCFRPWVRLMPREDTVEVNWYYLVGFQCMSLALLWLHALFECYFFFFLLDTQRNEYPKHLGTFKMNLILPKLSENYNILFNVTLWDLWASSLSPSQIVYVTLNTINDVVWFEASIWCRIN
jgi:hypothetical protein